MRLWRISEFLTLAGTGGLMAAGRWNRPGRPITYMAESSALAMLEVLVNLDLPSPPESFQLIEIDVPDDLAVMQWPEDQNALDPALTADWGDAFLNSRKTPLARIPSVVAPKSWNYLLNPLHADAAGVTVVAAARWPWDARLFGA